MKLEIERPFNGSESCEGDALQPKYRAKSREVQWSLCYDKNKLIIVLVGEPEAE